MRPKHLQVVRSELNTLRTILEILDRQLQKIEGFEDDVFELDESQRMLTKLRSLIVMRSTRLTWIARLLTAQDAEEAPVCPSCHSKDITGLAVVRWDDGWSAQGSEPYEKDYRCESETCDVGDFKSPFWLTEAIQMPPPLLDLREIYLAVADGRLATEDLTDD